jgi:hypothetical protein
MENKKDSTFTSLSKPIYAFFSILFACILFFGGITTIIVSALFKPGYIFEGLMMTGVGACLITCIYNMVLYIESISHTARIVQQFDQLATAQSKFHNVGSMPIFTFEVEGKPQQKNLQEMSDKELKDELDKAVAAEDYDLAVQIRAEKLRRNI